MELDGTDMKLNGMEGDALFVSVNFISSLTKNSNIQL